MPGMLWDLYCRVVDNLGDAGVCWRLAADLAARGEHVRLLIDDRSALDFMAPDGAAGVSVLPWPGSAAAHETFGRDADVVIEAFGCELPAVVVTGIEWAVQTDQAPVWINLEYLSAEAWVERSHGLPSPQRGGGTKWFYFPGFSPRTGGLLREGGLVLRRDAFEGRRWLARFGLEPRVCERVVSLFCYDNAALPALLVDLAREPTLLLVTAAVAAQWGADRFSGPPTPGAGHLRLHVLPWLSQTDFDHLLWSCDLNLVRGEDSLVRAIWAGVPFVWQAYPQHDGAHHAKVQALIDRLRLPEPVAALWRAWNGMPQRSERTSLTPSQPSSLKPWPGLPPLRDWVQAAAESCTRLIATPDLTSQLLDFVHMHRSAAAT